MNLPTCKLANSSAHGLINLQAQWTHKLIKLANSQTNQLTNSPTHQLTNSPTHQLISSSTYKLKNSQTH